MLPPRLAGIKRRIETKPISLPAKMSAKMLLSAKMSAKKS